MTEQRYAIRPETDTAGRVTRLHLIGRFDRSAHDATLRAVRGALARRRPTTLIVDMSAVIFLGGECVHVLLGGYARALRAGHGYEVVGAAGHVRYALEAVGLCPRTDLDDLLYGPAWPDAVEDSLWLGALDELAAP